VVKEILVGDNPFIGVSHLSQEKAREEAREATLERRVAVLQAAVEAGGTGFTFSTHPANLELLTYMHDNHMSILKKLNYYILTPYAQHYVRLANVQGTPVMVRSLLASMVYRKTAVIDLAITLLTLDLNTLAYLLIEAQIAPYLKVLPKQNIKAILLHETVTDLATAYNLVYLFKDLDHQLRQKIGVPLGLETRNLPFLYHTLRHANYIPQYIMTPLNPLGYQMAPDRYTVERTVRKTGNETRYVAISILAAGAIKPLRAVKYLASYKHSIYAVVTASSKAYRIKSNIHCLLSLIDKNNR